MNFSRVHAILFVGVVRRTYDQYNATWRRSYSARQCRFRANNGFARLAPQPLPVDPDMSAIGG